MKPIELSERDIQRQCLQYLNYNGFFAFRYNSGMVKINDKNGTRMIKLGEAGMPDILAIKKGQFYGFEVKRPKAKPTPWQLMAHEKLKTYGAKVYIVHSLAELQKHLGGR